MNRRISAAVVAALAAVLLVAAPAAALSAPSSFGLVSGGASYTSLHVRWAWSTGPSGYQIQSARNAGFTSAVHTLSVKRASSRPAGGLQRAYVRSLGQATLYYLRIRSVKGTSHSAWSRTVTASTRAYTPDAVTAVKARAGNAPGEIAFTWTAGGGHTSYFRLETATTEFSPFSGSGLPRKGRNWTSFTISPGTRTYTLSASQTAAAGAPVQSGNHLYFRLFAVDNPPQPGSTAETSYQYEQIARSAGKAATGASPLRVANYNVHTIEPGDSGQLLWTTRGPRVADDIIAAHPGIVTLEELSPGPVHPDAGYTGIDKVNDSQAAYLVKYLHDKGATQYALTRTSSYTWSTSGIQGARILYDTTKYQLLSSCSDQNSSGQYQSPDCAFQLYKRSVDNETFHRWAAYAHFQEIATGTTFWVLTRHQDNRNPADYTQRLAFEQLRQKQLEDALTYLETRTGWTAGEPIILGMDQNTWQSNPPGFLPHGSLISDGFYDTAGAVTKTNFQYATENKQYDTGLKQAATSLGAGARLDVIATLGMPGAATFDIWHHDDTLVRSDHNMVTADVELP